jgi:soluble lytic murein transglycosylase-like protein
MGLMQLMPDTAKSLGVTDPFNPEQNIEGGTSLLRGLLDRYHGQLDLALAAYNAGPAAVDKYGGVPPYPETQAYVRNIMASYREAALSA